MSYKNEWFLLEADDNIDEIEHREPTEEFLFYRAVATGDIETVRKNCEAGRFVEGEGVGVLSRDPVVNLKYHFVITTAMITRLCRQNGMELEQAFRMSDFYIRKLDDIHTEAEVHSLHDEMVMDFTEKMRKYARNDTNSKHINACKEYIYSHIKERITIEDLADELGVSSGYLSRLFKKETGISVSAYIRSQKIDMAKNLLRFSDYSMIDIANRLSFSSQSHSGTLNPALRVRKEIPPECQCRMKCLIKNNFEQERLCREQTGAPCQTDRENVFSLVRSTRRPCLCCPKGYSVRRISFSSLSSPSGI